MKNLFFCVLFLMLAPRVDAQQNVDSLLIIWRDETLPDTTRLDALKSVALNYSYSHPDSSLYYAKKQYEFAKKRNLSFFMGSALNMQGVIHFNQADYSLALTNFNQCIEVLKKMISNNDRVNSANYGMAGALMNCGSIYLQRGNSIEALKYYTRSIPIFEKITENKGKAVALSSIAMIYNEQNDFPNAIIYNQKAINILKKTNSKDNKQAIVYSLFHYRTLFSISVFR